MTAWAAPEAPAAPDLADRLDSGNVAALVEDQTVAELEPTRDMLAEQHAKGVSLTSARLIDVDLSGSSLERLDLTDLVLRGCNLANARAPGVSAFRVLIERSRLTGVQLTEGLLRDVIVRECRVDLATFGFSHLERVSFEDCVLTQSDFLDGQLESVRFHRCDLTGADFRGARLTSCEFRASDLSDLQGIECLRGAAMPWVDVVAMAGAWATALGIEILDG